MNVRSSHMARTARTLALGALGFTSVLSVSARAQDADQIARGRYLAIAADCAACHTKPGSSLAYAGGYGIASPLGSIYSTNITPSKQYGIGNYTLAQFTAVLRRGIRGDGAHLYPAMPYTSYVRLTDDDIASLYAYFMHGVKPVDVAAPVTALPFPFNVRASMMFWNALYLNAKPFVPDPNKSAEVNRGAYLALALGHCDTCHTPRNAMMAEVESQQMGGAAIASWFAPNITSAQNAGIATWSAADLARYLKTGDVPGRAQAAGPMAEAIEHSFQYLNDDDINAIVAYVKQLPANASATVVDRHQTQPRDAFGAVSAEDAVLRGAPKVDRGALIYDGACASCHQPTGLGSKDGYYPQLFHNTATGADTPYNLVATILEGVNRTIGTKHYYMPGFGRDSYVQHLSDKDIAAVSNYVLKQFGNPAARVSAQDVANIRAGGPKPVIAQISPYFKPGLAALVALVVLVAAIFALRFRR